MSDWSRPPGLSRIALGCYPLGGGYGPLSEGEALVTIDGALDVGWTFFDAAETYLEAEERLGRLLTGRRDRVFLATKAFPCEPYTAVSLQAALESSLRRLRTDRVDLYQLHGPEDWVAPFGPTPWDEIAGALEQLRASGKALRIGVCNLPLGQLDALASRTELFSTQNLYSLLDREQASLLPYVRSRGMALLAYSPLGRGLLVEGLDRNRCFPPEDERHFLPRFQHGVYEQYVDVAERLAAWAADQGRTLTQLAIAWLLSHPGVTSVLVGAKRPEHIAAVAGADDWQLSEQDFAEIEAILHTLPAEARAADHTVWDHVDPAWLDRLRRRRVSS